MHHRLIFLDGFYAGHVTTWHEAPPIFKMMVPARNIICDCYEDDAETIPKEPEQIEYKRTFISEDGRVILYSLSGESETIEKNRGWIVKEKPYWPSDELKPLTMFCRDERAFS